jgi:4-amino-4-deoxy-L-arabinose transferase-like glycosyltransferase
MEKIVISPAEVAETQTPADQPARMEPKLAPAVPPWAKWTMSPLVLVLPLLCLVAIVLRVAMRGLPPRTRHEWTSLLATLLIVGGIVTSVATVLVFSFAPLPPVAGVGLSELDEQTFPSLPVAAPMSAHSRPN